MFHTRRLYNLHTLAVALSRALDRAPQQGAKLTRAIIDQRKLMRRRRDSLILKQWRRQTIRQTTHLSVGLAHHQKQITPIVHFGKQVSAKMTRQAIEHKITPIFP